MRTLSQALAIFFISVPALPADLTEHTWGQLEKDIISAIMEERAEPLKNWLPAADTIRARIGRQTSELHQVSQEWIDEEQQKMLTTLTSRLRRIHKVLRIKTIEPDKRNVHMFLYSVNDLGCSASPLEDTSRDEIAKYNGRFLVVCFSQDEVKETVVFVIGGDERDGRIALLGPMFINRLTRWQWARLFDWHRVKPEEDRWVSSIIDTAFLMDDAVFELIGEPDEKIKSKDTEIWIYEDQRQKAAFDFDKEGFLRKYLVVYQNQRKIIKTDDCPKSLPALDGKK